MGKYIKQGGLLAIAICLSYSCTEKLMLNPVSEISNANFWKTENDAMAGMYGMYVRARIPAQSSFFFWGEGRSDVMGPSNYLGDAGALLNNYYENNLNATNSASTYNGGNTTWQNLYSVVHHANLIIKNTPAIEFRSDAAKNDILAQAYTMRAYIYFLMAKVWGDVPLVTEPIESVDPLTIRRERTPVSEIFTFIKEDLSRALELYPTANLTAKRNTWSKPAANVLKADVFLWTAKRMNGGNADLNTALAALEEAEKSDVILLDNFAGIFDYTNKGNKEIMMAIHLSELEVTALADRREGRFMYIHPAIPPNISTWSRAKIGAPSPHGGYWAPRKEICDQFGKDDQRGGASFFQIFTQNASGDSTYYTTLAYKFKGTVIGGSRAFVDDVVLYRYADVLLLRAEVKNALGMDPSDDINAIRRRAYGAYYADHIFVPGSREQNDNAILEERLFEFLLEGKRWWDLVRFGKAFELVPSLKSRPGQNHLLLFPIPEVTLALEPLVEQNQGY